MQALILIILFNKIYKRSFDTSSTVFHVFFYSFKNSPVKWLLLLWLSFKCIRNNFLSFLCHDNIALESNNLPKATSAFSHLESIMCVCAHTCWPERERMRFFYLRFMMLNLQSSFFLRWNKKSNLCDFWVRWKLFELKNLLIFGFLFT